MSPTIITAIISMMVIFTPVVIMVVGKFVEFWTPFSDIDFERPGATEEENASFYRKWPDLGEEFVKAGENYMMAGQAILAAAKEKEED